jgi:hypothetical protein
VARAPISRTAIKPSANAGVTTAAPSRS